MTDLVPASNVLSFPSGDGRRRLSIPMERIERAEARMEEVQYVTKDKAPELMTALNRGWLFISQVALRINQHLLRAEEETSGRKAEIILDVLPEMLQRKKLRSSEEVREAIFRQDAEYMTCVHREAEIRAVLELLKLKAKAIYEALRNIQKIVNTPSLMGAAGAADLGYRPGRELPATAYQPNGLLCAVCHLPQFETPSGAACAQGHAGAPGYEREEEERT